MIKYVSVREYDPTHSNGLGTVHHYNNPKNAVVSTYNCLTVTEADGAKHTFVGMFVAHIEETEELTLKDKLEEAMHRG